MNNDKFIVVDHEYYNTGGNCMVSIFQVYDVDANATRYCICGDDSFSWQTANTIYNEFLQLDCDENINKLVLGSWEYSALTTEPCWDQPQFTDEQWEMFKYCQFEHYKKDCKYFNIKVNVPINELPIDLYSTLTDDYKAWAKENDWTVQTDGFKVFLNESYVAPQPPKSDRLKELEAFVEHMRLALPPHESEYPTTADFEKAEEEHANMKWTIVFEGKAITIENCAAIYNCLKDGLEEIIGDEQTI